MALEKKYTQVKHIIVGENDLLTWCMEHGEEGQNIINEWDEDKNGSMSNYKAGSNKSVHWVCNICGQSYIKEIKNRVAGRLHEPCGRKRGVENLKQFHKKRMVFERSLAGVRPDLLTEWDYEKNDKCGDRPEYLSVQSSKYVNWVCKKCGNKWRAQIRMRSTYGYGCKACRKQKISR